MFKGNLSKSVSHSFFVNILSYFTQPFLQYNVIYNFCVKKGGGLKLFWQIILSLCSVLYLNFLIFADLKFVLTCEVEKTPDTLFSFNKEYYTKRLVAGGGLSILYSSNANLLIYIYILLSFKLRTFQNLFMKFYH